MFGSGRNTALITGLLVRESGALVQPVLLVLLVLLVLHFPHFFFILELVSALGKHGVFGDVADAEVGFAALRVFFVRHDLLDARGQGHLSFRVDVVFVVVDGDEERDDVTGIAREFGGDLGFGEPIGAVLLEEVVVHAGIGCFVRVIFAITGEADARGNEHVGVGVALVGAGGDIGQDIFDGLHAIGGVMIEGARGMKEGPAAVADEGYHAEDKQNQADLEDAADPVGRDFLGGGLGALGLDRDELIHLRQVAVTFDAENAAREDGGMAVGAEFKRYRRRGVRSNRSRGGRGGHHHRCRQGRYALGFLFGRGMAAGFAIVITLGAFDAFAGANVFVAGTTECWRNGGHLGLLA